MWCTIANSNQQIWQKGIKSRLNVSIGGEKLPLKSRLYTSFFSGTDGKVEQHRSSIIE